MINRIQPVTCDLSISYFILRYSITNAFTVWHRQRALNRLDLGCGVLPINTLSLSSEIHEIWLLKCEPLTENAMRLSLSF